MSQFDVAVIGSGFGGSVAALRLSEKGYKVLGGAVIAQDSSHGVVDGYLHAFGQPGLHIVDGSALSANPGVNPSLSIAALAEWAMAHWPNKGEQDTRPALGERFEVVDSVKPKNPAVPTTASGALKLPIRPI